MEIYLQFYTLIFCCHSLFPSAACSYVSQNTGPAHLQLEERLQEDTCAKCEIPGEEDDDLCESGVKYKGKCLKM